MERWWRAYSENSFYELPTALHPSNFNDLTCLWNYYTFSKFMFMSQELQRIHISTNFFTKMSTQLRHYERHIMMHVVISVMLKIIFLVNESSNVAFGQHLLNLAMSSIYHVILYLYPLPDFDCKILPNTSKCVNPRTRFVFHFFNFWELGFYFQTLGIQYSFLRTSVMNLKSQHETPLPGEGFFFPLFAFRGF